ncbi:5-oxoprolinase subunit PxpB [Fredinandcohnia sp. 179-A 10B2 NHS]|uniref:5-oxoprolinase subunit PxpB n=1 Tax=Fredinandcohnia sp. 179-A 10B2 NHS TaxID=3235176 RepID=UPI0039A034E1
MEIEVFSSGDMAVHVTYKLPVTETLHRRIQETCKAIRELNLLGVVEIVPGFNTITVYYDPLVTTYFDVYKFVLSYSILVKGERDTPTKEIITIPTCYGSTFGEDLEHVALIHNLTEEEVIKLHCSANYLVYMIGFLPGFPYLNGLKDEIKTPRLATPRLKVPQGAVGIGGNQTGIYPLESPGGWNLIGRTPVRLFDPTKSSPFLLKAGDTIRFTPISRDEFYEIEAQINENKYEVQREVIKNETD